MSGQYIFNSNTAVTALDGDDQLLIGNTGAVTVVGGIVATGSGNTINVLGTVFGGGIKMGSDATNHQDNHLFIGESGYINGTAANYAVFMLGNNSVVENAGTVWNGNSGGNGIVTSDGSLTSETRIINSGTIDVFSVGLDFNNIGKVHVENSGLIKAATAITGFSGAMDVKNTGEIIGTVVLGFGNDIFDTRLGKVTGDVNAGQGNDILYGSKGSDIFSGNAGNDKLYGYSGNDELYGSDGIDTVMGGDGDDTLFGNSEADNLYGETGNDYVFGGDGNDKIYGGTGTDTISGGQGVDQLSGGTGADMFDFNFADTGATKATADTIFDFEKIDHINLVDIDANTKHAGDDKFSFIGTQGFHGKAGELRYEKLASDTYIYGDTNGDKKADLVIHLDDAVTLKAEYFVL